jgi:carbon-monoxide dehydrogenase large subunit
VSSSPQRYGSSQANLRSEDLPLITGRGRFTDDVSLPGQVYGVFVRAAVGHAELRGIDVSQAKQAPGVLAVLTAADADAAGLGSVPPAPAGKGRDGRPLVAAPLTVFARGRIRHVGESLALVIAESEQAAQDAAELVQVDFEELPAAATVAAAMAPDAPQIHADAPGNVAFDYEDGDPAAWEKAAAAAHHVERVRLFDPRVAPCAMEPRAALAAWDAASGRYTLTACTQGVAAIKMNLANNILKVPPAQVRVLTYDVGGGFGMKAQIYADYGALLLAAKSIGRPVKWCATRLESFLCDTHGRDGILEGAMAFDPDGKITALSANIWMGIGAATTGPAGMFTTTNTKNCLSSVYAIPAIHLRSRVMFTNAAPLGPYRGAGRPEAVFLVERLIDAAALSLGIDRVDLRRRNMVPPSAMPYSAANGQIYDSGEFEAVLDKALAGADWQGFAARRAASEKGGRLRGIGIGCFLEIAGAALEENADLRFADDGYIELYIGAQGMGQGSLTTFPQVVARHLGVDVAKIRMIQGDSDLVPAGPPSVGSRSVMMMGSALVLACDEAIRRGKEIAGEVLEAAAADIEYGDGEFRVAGTDVKMSLLDLAAAARALPALPEAAKGGLDNIAKFVSPRMTYPNGCHICEVEIDPDTGVVRVVGYTAVDDVGNIVNETIVAGQIHGGVMQGLGQVLGEQIVYDEGGQLLTASFMDYRMPRASDMPAMTVLHHSVPATTNPLGAKGAGESGVAGALPAAVNAIRDALATRGVRDLDMPYSPARVWEALREAAR